MTDKAKLYAVKNDEGEWMSLDGTQTGIWYFNNLTLFKDNSYAEAQSMGRRAHVVELVEAPEKVVVSEDEAKMLDALSDGELMPIGELAYFIHHAEQLPEKESIKREDRLMRAYVNGYTVAKEPKYYVKVPKKWSGDDKHYWTKEQDGALTWAYLINKDYMIPAQQFTAAEIEHYGLQDCEKLEVKTNG